MIIKLKIKNIKKLDEFFEKDENFDLKQYSQQSFGIFNSRPKKVELLFDKSVRDDVLSYHFHPTQKLKENGDGSISVTFILIFCFFIMYFYGFGFHSRYIQTNC